MEEKVYEILGTVDKIHKFWLQMLEKMSIDYILGTVYN